MLGIVVGTAGKVRAQAFLPALPDPMTDRAEYRAGEFSFGTFGTDSMGSKPIDPFFD